MNTQKASHDSSLALHTFLTQITLLIKKVKDFGDKDNQNQSFEILKTKAKISDITAEVDYQEAMNWLYDLIKGILSVRNKDDDLLMKTLMQTMVSVLSQDKNISESEAVDFLCMKLKKTVFQKFFTDGIPDLDPRGVLLLLKLSGCVDENMKFSNPIGRGKLSEFTTIDSGNKRLFFDIPPYGKWEGKKIQDLVFSLKKHAGNGTFSKLIESSLVPGAQLVIDHHDRYCQSTSSIHMIFVMLDALGKIPADRREQIEAFVTFIDMADDMYYQIAGLDQRLSVDSLMGLQRELLYKGVISIESIFAYFVGQGGKRKSGLEVLTDQDLDLLSGGKIALCKKLRADKIRHLSTGEKHFNSIKGKQTFYHHKRPFLYLLEGKMYRNLDVTTKYGYGMLQLNDKVGEIKVHNSTGFDQKFLDSVVHPAIKVMKGRNIFVKANEPIDDETIRKFLLDLGCPKNIAEEMLKKRNEILSKK